MSDKGFFSVAREMDHWHGFGSDWLLSRRSWLCLYQFEIGILSAWTASAIGGRLSTRACDTGAQVSLNDGFNLFNVFVRVGVAVPVRTISTRGSCMRIVPSLLHVIRLASGLLRLYRDISVT